MKLILDIDINNNKALALINYIRTLDFISIKENDNTFENSLTIDQIKTLKDRKTKHLNNESKSYSWDSIKQELNTL